MPVAAEDPQPPLSPDRAPGSRPAALALLPCLTPRAGDTRSDRALLADLLGPGLASRAGSICVELLLEATPAQLTELGLPPAARRRLLAAAELARRFQPCADEDQPCLTARDALARLAPLRIARAELLAVLCLDARMGVIGEPAIVAVGTVMHVGVAPREVFAPALERSAAAIVLAHNHPSGGDAPSDEDRRFTEDMAGAGRVLGIPVVDHLVVTRRSYFSFADAGLMRR